MATPPFVFSPNNMLEHNDQQPTGGIQPDREDSTRSEGVDSSRSGVTRLSNRPPCGLSSRPPYSNLAHSLSKRSCFSHRATGKKRLPFLEDLQETGGVRRGTKPAKKRCVSAWLDAMRQPHQRRRPEPRRLPRPPTRRTHRSQRGHQHAPESGWKRSGLQGWMPASDRRSG